MVLFASVTIYGIWLLATDQYPVFIGTKIQFTSAIVGTFLITILLTAHLSYVPLDKLQASLDEVEKRSRQNQDAILRLLDEMGDLADGDLTVSATVTENITGAIADSVNFTIDELRNLVTQINTTTLQVASAAQETQATALHLTDASDHQAQQITEVSTAITDMAGSIEQVSQNASQSSDVATQSVNLAAQGNEAVKKAISGMDTIREQIQETSKRMKRLGESSQQIGGR
jgi:twitching motility protein PilJ